MEKENTLPPYEDNDEYDYGHNVPRYHIDGEGDLTEFDAISTKNGQNRTKQAEKMPKNAFSEQSGKTPETGKRYCPKR
ncbi:MAG: hypothetical protein LKI53_02445 [Bacteroidales bacterium]|jgi:hypothetical protein|nr:hypothetical protein [Bacteroidales bacterium]